jgi:Zn finger protein HypA/HybF involved in hydrogenase expression
MNDEENDSARDWCARCRKVVPVVEGDYAGVSYPACEHCGAQVGHVIDEDGSRTRSESI